MTATVLFDCNSFIILDKPHGLPTVPLKNQNIQDSLLGQAIKYDAQIMQIKGKNPWEGGTIHRLDTVTGGLVVFAKNQSFYDYLQETQKEGLFEKYYVAKTIKNDSLKGQDIEEKQNLTTIESYFRPFGPGAKRVKPTLDLKKAEPKELYTTLALRKKEGSFSEVPYDAYNDSKNLCNTFFCTITKGFRHQIRAHLAWIGYPIIGDALYNNATDETSHETQCQSITSIKLDCVGLSFVDKTKKTNCFMKKEFLFEDFAHTSRFAKNTSIAIIEL